MKLVGSRNQEYRDPLLVADGTVPGSGTQHVLVLPERKSTSFLLFQNVHATAVMYLEFGSARATATLSSGVVNAITVTNGGFGFTRPPLIEFHGGGLAIGFNTNLSTNFVSVGLAGYPSPHGQIPSAAVGVMARPAKAHAVLTGGVVTSIVIDDGGAGYTVAPFVFIRDDLQDPSGCADPFFNSATSGIYVAPAGGSFKMDATSATTDPMAVYSSTAGAPFVCRWSP